MTARLGNICFSFLPKIHLWDKIKNKVKSILQLPPLRPPQFLQLFGQLFFTKLLNLPVQNPLLAHLAQFAIFVFTNKKNNDHNNNMKIKERNKKIVFLGHFSFIRNKTKKRRKNIYTDKEENSLWLGSAFKWT